MSNKERGNKVESQDVGAAPCGSPGPEPDTQETGKKEKLPKKPWLKNRQGWTLIPGTGWVEKAKLKGGKDVKSTGTK